MPSQSERNAARLRALASLATITDEEDRALIAAAEADPDNPPLTESDWEKMRPAPKWMLRAIDRRL